MTYIKSQKINKSHNRIWGTFKLSDKSTTHFEVRQNESLQQWGNSTENLGLSVDIIEKLESELYEG